MGNELSKFNKKFNLKELSLLETDYWIWSLRPVQATLGAGVLSLKRECAEFGQLTKEEFDDLYEVIPIIEKTLKNRFNYDIINYLMLMMNDKHVHFHVIPRYEKSINFADREWKDTGWPATPNLKAKQVEIEVLQSVKNEILMHL